MIVSLGAVCLVCLLIAAMFIYEEHKEHYVRAVVLKGMASLCFVFLGYWTSQIGSDLVFNKPVLIGLLLGMLADILLNLRFVFKKQGRIVFLIGILVFLTGHIMYLVALLPKCLNIPVVFGVGAVLTTVMMIWIFKKITAQKAFKVFGVFYIGAITIMTCTAVRVFTIYQTPGYLMFVAGAVLFLISDIVLILNTFGAETKFGLRITNLSLYYLGQLMIALSLIFI